MVSNCCFLTWIQISQEAGQVVWYSHVFKNFPQFVVINTVKGFGVVSKAEVGVFLEFSCFFWWSNGCWQFDLWLFSLVQFSHPVMSNSLWPHGVHVLCLHVHYLLPEFTQTHVHWGGDASNQLILCCPLLLPPSIFPYIRVFSNEPVLHSRWPKYWSFSFSISPSNEHPDWSPLGWLVGSPCSPRDSQKSSPTSQFKSISSSVFSLLYDPTLTPVHDYWKNHSFD